MDYQNIPIADLSGKGNLEENEELVNTQMKKEERI
jgi:hypothetical protein